MYGKRKSGVFFAVSAGFQVSFLEISQRRHVRDVVTTSNVQVTITVRVWTSPLQGREFYFIHWGLLVEGNRREKSHWIPMGK